MHVLAQLIRIVLIAMLVIAPWFFGAVWAQVQWILMLVAGLLMAFELVTRFSDDDRPNLVPSAWLPILGGVVLGLTQLVNWPAGLADTMAPRTIELRQQLTSDEASDAQLTAAEMGKTIGGSQRTRSVYPLATREYLALLTLAMSIFVLGSVHLVTKQSVLWAFVATGICGSALAFFGLIQRLSWNGKFYWVVEPLSGGFSSFGPFVNRNNAGGFLNLCLAASVGLLVWLHWRPEMETDVVKTSDRNPSRRSRRSSSRGEGEARRSGSGERASSRQRGRSSKSRTETPDGAGSAATTEPEDAEELAGEVVMKRVERVESPDEVVAPTPSGEMESSRTDGGETDVPEPTDESESATDETNSDASLGDALKAAYEATREQAMPDKSEPAPEPPAPPAAPKTPRRKESSESDSSPSGSARRQGSRKQRTRQESGRGRSSSRESYGDRVYPDSYEMKGQSSGVMESITDRISSYFAELNAPRVWALLLVAFSAGGVMSTASRGSILAMFAATMITITALMFRRGQRGYAAGLLVMLVAGLGLMSWAGQTEFVKQRFDMMFEQDMVERGRLPNWLEATRAVPQFPWLGSGLGTYRWVYERYQERFLDGTIHTHAENQFLQTLVEAGFLGLFFLVAQILLVAVAILRLFRAGGQVNTSLALMGTFALSSQLFGGCFDFGLYIPSNTIMMAALCGMVIGRAALLSIWSTETLDAIDLAGPTGFAHAGLDREWDNEGVDANRAPQLANDSVISTTANARKETRTVQQRGRGGQALLAIGAPSSIAAFLIGFLLLGCLFGSLEMNRAAKVEAAMRPAQLYRLTSSDDIPSIDAGLAPITAVLPQRWDDALAHQELAKLLLQRYRATVYQTLSGQQSDDSNATNESPTPPKRDPDLWARASSLHLHGSIRKLQRAGRSDAAAVLINSETVQQYLVPARRHLLLSRQIAPTIPETHYLLAELSPIANDNESKHLERAHQLSPGNATIWFLSGLLDINSGRQDDACKAWNKSLLLTERYLDDIAVASQGKITVKRLLFDVLPPRADYLLKVARKHFSSPAGLRFRPHFLRQAEAALPKTDLPPAEAAYTEAWIYRLQDRKEEARTQFDIAVTRNSTQLTWRREFIALLMELEEYNEAHEHATYLVRARPKNRGFERLLRQVNSKRLRKVE